MNGWLHDVVSMMAEGSGPRIKQEIMESSSCCSPTQSTPNSTQAFAYPNNHGTNDIEFKSGMKESELSPGSPDRQYCSSTTTSIGDMCTDSKDVIKDEAPKRLCLVCGDTASGFHYGVASCEACKAFFKRTIQGNIEYSCPANNQCEINKRRRKACQACRFQKCLLMGMLKEGVRLDRVRGGRQKYRRNPTMSPYQLLTPQPFTSTSPTSLEEIRMLEILSNYEPDAISVGPVGNDLMNKSTDDKEMIDVDEKLIDTKSTTSKLIPDALEMLNILSDIYDRELVNTIGWAKQIPGFTELPLNDQMRMLQVTWAEILTLQLAYRSIPFNGRLSFASDFWLDERSAKECGAVELYNHCAQITQRLEKISPRKEEYYLLKALVLSNCDIRLDNVPALRKFRDSILSTLNECVYLIRHSGTMSHLQQLLLLLPSLRQADNVVRKFWTKIFTDGSINMNKLLIEMLESVV